MSPNFNKYFSILILLAFLTSIWNCTSETQPSSSAGDVLSLGVLVGFVTVLGIAARNTIMLVSHYRHLEKEEGMAIGFDLIMRGAMERLAPILMTALAAALALLPIVLGGTRPGQEIEHPMAVVILGGLLSSTLLNLMVMPVLYWRFSTKQMNQL